jgi:uncharacterized protein (TIGR02391 family)
MAIRERFPTIEDLLRASPEDLGAEIVLYLQERRPQTVAEANLPGDFVHLYGLAGTTEDLSLAIAEGLAWAKRSLLLVYNPAQSAHWLILTRAGKEFTREALNRIHLRELLPDFMLHPAIRSTCLDIFNTGHHEAAVFEAFKTLEIAVREAAGLPEHEHGRPMVAKAFNPNSGPLTDPEEHFQEREALMMFASGAVGYFKNSRSHRRTDVSDAQEAAEMLIVASHLLRIVGSRR